MNYGMRFVTLYRREESRPSLWKRNAKKQNGCLGRPYKLLSKEEKQKARPGANCSSDHEHLIAKFRLKLKKVGETTRSFRYDLMIIQWK